MSGSPEPPGAHEVDLEFDFHLACAEADLRRHGLTPDQAHAEAARRFGDRARFKRRCLANGRPSRMTSRILHVSTLCALLVLGVAVWHTSRTTARLSAQVQTLALSGPQQLKAPAPQTGIAQQFDLGGASVPIDLSGASPARVTALNQNGRWREAESMAERLLAGAAGDAGRTDHAQVLAGLAHARLRGGDTPGATEAMTQLEQLLPDIPDKHWLHGESARIRAQLDATPPAPLPPPAEAPHEWPTATPEAMGMDRAVVDAHRELCEETGADTCLVVHRGAIVSEWTRPGFSPPVYAMSSTKSITSLLVGCLIDDGLLDSIDTPVGEYLPDWESGVRGDVTIRHLLSHTSGLPKLEGESVGFVRDKNAFVRSLSPSSPPGSAFAYSNEGVQLLSPVLDAIAGEPIQDYARRRLFLPLGMRETKLQLDTEDHAWTYADMNTTPRDMARIGQMMLQEGVWNGRRVVSRDWIERSLTPSQAFREDCGLLWWIHESPPGFAALGYLHTDIHVFPGLDLVVVRTQSRRGADAEYPDYRERAKPLLARMVKRQ